MASLNPHIEEDEKEFLFEQYYQNFVNNLIMFKNLILEHFFESFDVDRLIFVGQTMKEFIEVIKQYLHRVKRKMVEDTALEVKYSEKIKAMDVDIEEMHKEMDALENISYKKLTDLREKNDKLNILEHHIDNLTRENEEISRKLI